MDLIGLVVLLILIGLAFWAVRTLGPALSIPPPIITVIYVVMVVLVVVYLLRVLGLSNGGPAIQLR